MNAPAPPGPRLAAREGARVRALVVLALLCVAPAALRGRGEAGPAPGPRCAAGAVRTEAGVRCRPAAGEALPPLAAWWMGAPLDLNEASARDLEVVPGIGPALAARIVEDRQARGPFSSLADVQRVKGIGPALAARLAAVGAVHSSAQGSSAVDGTPNR